MKQPHFVVVIAHSVHGRLRRVHLSHTVLYTVLGLAAVGCFTVAGFIASYARMAWKVGNYNNLRDEVSSLQRRYQDLQKSSEQTREQLATLQILASEVSTAYGIKERMDGPRSLVGEGKLMPTFQESIEQYDLLRSTRLFNPGTRRINQMWQQNVVPSIWPTNGRLLSSSAPGPIPSPAARPSTPASISPAPRALPLKWPPMALSAPRSGVEPTASSS